jgi:hypothetical protein
MPHSLQIILENKLTNKYPNHDLTEPFTVEQVSEIAEAYFQRDKFSQMLLGTGPSLEAESTNNDSDSASSDSDDSSDNESRKRRRKKIRAKRAKKA